MGTLKKVVKGGFLRLGLDIRRTSISSPPPIPDGQFYTPLFSPWNDYGDFADYRVLAAPYTLVSRDRLYALYTLALNAIHLQGDFWECGVYKGGTARMFAEFLVARGRPDLKLHLFDTFGGMPETDEKFDIHLKGDFSDTSLDEVRRVVGHPDRVEFHPGWIPDIFRGMSDSRVAFAHVDVDIYQSILDCCEFIYPRLAIGGVMVFDDYGFPTCPGARKAVDEFFADKPEVPIVLQTGQAIVVRSAAATKTQP